MKSSSSGRWADTVELWSKQIIRGGDNDGENKQKVWDQLQSVEVRVCV